MSHTTVWFSLGKEGELCCSWLPWAIYTHIVSLVPLAAFTFYPGYQLHPHLSVQRPGFKPLSLGSWTWQHHEEFSCITLTIVQRGLTALHFLWRIHTCCFLLFITTDLLCHRDSRHYFETESIALNLESHQDPTEWERENFSRQKLTCTCGRKEVGYRAGCGLGLVKRDPDTTWRASGTVAGSRLALALPARGLAKEN